MDTKGSGASGGSITCCNIMDRGPRKRLNWGGKELKNMRCEVVTKCLLLFASHSHSDETRTIKIFQQLDLDTGLLLAYLCFQILPCSVVSCVEGAWKEKCCFGNHLICTLFFYLTPFWHSAHSPREFDVCMHIIPQILSTYLFPIVDENFWKNKLLCMKYQAYIKAIPGSHP